MVWRSHTIVLQEFSSLVWEQMSNWVDILDTEKHIGKVDGIK
jgi:hypothetical protein